MIKSSFLVFLLTVVLIAFSAADADAFPERERGWIFGIMGGVNNATVNFVPDASADPHPGFSGGIFAEYHLAQEMVFRPQVLYTQKGFSVEEDSEELMADFTFRGEHIDVVTPFIYSFELHSEFVPQIMVSPTFSYAIDSELDGIYPEEYSDDLNLFDFGAMVGIGGIQHFRNFAVTIDLRHNWGFLDTGIHEDDAIRNQGFQLNLGIRF